MQIVAIVSQKGGAGKTTLSVHLAVAAARHGKSVALIDLDPQATAAQWGDWRGGENPAVVATPYTRLAATLAEAKEAGVELVFLDSPPAADAAAVSAARAADLVLVPTRVSAFDLHAIKTTAELMRIAQKPAFTIFNAVPPRAANLIEDAAAVVRAIGMPLAPVCLTERAAFRHAVVDGHTAIEYEPGGKAASEVDAVYNWMMGRLNRPQSLPQAA
jgi:chromosome partitioning protein